MGWSIEAAEFINKLIQRRPINRLGIHGPDDVKNHAWFKDFQWDKLEAMELDAPFIPTKIEDFFEHRHLNSDPKDLSEEQIQTNAALLKRLNIQNMFAGY